MVRKHLMPFFWEISARDMKDVLVMSKGEVDVVEPTIRPVHAVLCLILADTTVGIRRKELWKNNLLGVCATNRESVADYGQLWLAIQAKNFSEVVQEARKDKPTWVAVFPDCFRCLEEMLDLRKVGVRIAFVNQRIQVFSHLPDTFRPAIQTAIFRFLVDDKIECLAGMILAIELRDGGVCVGFVIAEF